MPALIDDFNRVDNYTTLGAGYTNHLWIVGVYSNQAYPDHTGGYTSNASYDTPMSGDDVEVSVIVGAPYGSPSPDYVDVYVGCGPADANEIVLVRFANGGTDTSVIYTATSWGFAGLVSRDTASLTFTTGDKLTVIRRGNVYSTYKNDTLIVDFTWTDSGDVHPRDSSHRIIGLGGYRNAVGGGAFRPINALYAGGWSGAASGSWGWSGSAGGYSGPFEGSASGEYGWRPVGAALPYALPWVLGTGYGARGETPLLLPNEGAAGGAYGWVSAAAGEPVMKFGETGGAYDWVSDARGYVPSLGIGSTFGTYGWNGIAIGLTPGKVPLPPPPVFPPTPAVPLAMKVVSEFQAVTIHTFPGGTQLYQYLPDNQFKLVWGRTLKDVSRCDLSVPVDPNDDRLPDLTPWIHWVSVWDESATLLWTGPIQKVTVDRESMDISARDVSALMSRTRVMLTKRWDAAELSAVAGELWTSMIENHSLPVRSIIRPDPLGDPFDVKVEADAMMMDSKIDELVRLGLKWTVVAGVPIIGPVSLKPVASLSENDFIGSGLSLSRDGSSTFNDVLLKAADSITRTRVPMGELNLQTIVNVESMFGVSNATRAVQQYARHYGGIRTTVTLPPGVELQPDAPVTIDQLIPSSRFVIEAYGIRTLMQLTDVEVECTSGAAAVRVTMESVIELPELAKTNLSMAGGLDGGG